MKLIEYKSNITPKEYGKLVIFAVFVLLPILLVFWVITQIHRLFTEPFFEIEVKEDERV